MLERINPGRRLSREHKLPCPAAQTLRDTLALSPPSKNVGDDGYARCNHFASSPERMSCRYPSTRTPLLLQSTGG